MNGPNVGRISENSLAAAILQSQNSPFVNNYGSLSCRFMDSDRQSYLGV